MLLVKLINLELDYWTAEIGPTINDPAADQFRIVQANGGISLVMCSDIPYAGWLAKQVSSLPLEAARITFCYSMMTDDATQVCAQVAETDAKITDSEGWTYDLSAQWEMRKAAPDWMFQVDNSDWTWTDTGLVIPASEPYQPRNYKIEYLLDYPNRRSAIVSVDVGRQHYDLAEYFIPARQEGWAPSEIVTQLQQCNNSGAGGYTLRFSGVGYDLRPA